jgi:large subunit ribosomal protein L15
MTMRLNSISPAPGSKKLRLRVGRGASAGQGKTCGRGVKGQRARKGGYHKVGFEGGQMPLQRRVPKFGFKNNNKIYFKALNLDVLEGLAEKLKSHAITFQVLMENGLAGKNDKVKVLGRGELKSKVTVEAHAFSATAITAIEKVGGTTTIVK